jgi:hypothetical protein
MTSDEALTPKLVLLPGLDGTGKLFAEFLKALDLQSSVQVVPMHGVPHAQRVDVDGPHLLLKTRPQECAAAVLKFKREVG